MKYDEWRGAMDGRPVIWVKHLLCRRGFHVDLHKMVSVDDVNCFHTHPAYALRIILRGGYIEQHESGEWRTWRPGMIGLVRPETSHRIAILLKGGRSLSLWIRFPKRAKVHLRGDGWKKQEQRFVSPGTVMD